MTSTDKRTDFKEPKEHLSHTRIYNIYLPVYLSTYLSIYLSIYIYIHILTGYTDTCLTHDLHLFASSYVFSVTIWLFNSSPWKDPPFLTSENHLFLSISMGHGFHLYHGYVSHNQRVFSSMICLSICHLSITMNPSFGDPTAGPSQRSSTWTESWPMVRSSIQPLKWGFSIANCSFTKGYHVLRCFEQPKPSKSEIWCVFLMLLAQQIVSLVYHGSSLFKPEAAMVYDAFNRSYTSDALDQASWATATAGRSLRHIEPLMGRCCSNTGV